MSANGRGKYTPLITTDHIDYVSEGSYRVTGTLASMGDNEITELGICWGESEKPNIEGPSIRLGPPYSTGKFSVTVSGLSASTTYYFRAYAVIHSMPVYANEKTFTTRPSSENMVMDIDGNIYKTVQICNQTWMAENLKVTRRIRPRSHWSRNSSSGSISSGKVRDTVGAIMSLPMDMYMELFILGQQL